MKAIGQLLLGIRCVGFGRGVQHRPVSLIVSLQDEFFVVFAPPKGLRS